MAEACDGAKGSGKNEVVVVPSESETEATSGTGTDDMESDAAASDSWGEWTGANLQEVIDGLPQVLDVQGKMTYPKGGGKGAPSKASATHEERMAYYAMKNKEYEKAIAETDWVNDWVNEYSVLERRVEPKGKGKSKKGAERPLCVGAFREEEGTVGQQLPWHLANANQIPDDPLAPPDISDIILNAARMEQLESDNDEESDLGSVMGEDEAEEEMAKGKGKTKKGKNSQDKRMSRGSDSNEKKKKDYHSKAYKSAYNKFQRHIANLQGQEKKEYQRMSRLEKDNFRKSFVEARQLEYVQLHKTVEDVHEESFIEKVPRPPLNSDGGYHLVESHIDEPDMFSQCGLHGLGILCSGNWKGLRESISEHPVG